VVGSCKDDNEPFASSKGGEQLCFFVCADSIAVESYVTACNMSLSLFSLVVISCYS
jgi:hypothetical protein